MKKHKKSLLFYSHIENLIPFWDHDLQKKMGFSKNFLNSLKFKDLESNRISLVLMDEKTLQFLIFSILLEYDSAKEMEKPKRHAKDIFYLDTKDIFPTEEMTVEDVQFVDHCLTKLNVDLDEGHEVFVLSANQLVFLLRGIMREYNIFVGNMGKCEI
jgi:hypothetical protein